jgi:DNA-binding IclR family transcriptional regulator
VRLANTISIAPWQYDHRMASIMRRVAAEFREMPGMRLTEPQMTRLFDLSPGDCSAVLERLVESRLLKRDDAGRYSLAIA